MNRREIKQRINHAVNQITPDVYNHVANVPVAKMTAHDHITQQKGSEQSSRPAWTFRLAPAFASFAILMVAIVAWWQFLRVDSILSVDVNPSIELRLNRINHVVDLRTYNTEAGLIADKLAWRFKSFEGVLGQLLDRMAQQGYLQSDNSFLLLSYQQDNPDRAEALSLRLNKAVLGLKRQSPELVHIQKIEAKAIASLAEEYDVSPGVMQLILKAQIMNPQYSAEFLRELELQTLYWLAENEMKPAPESTSPSPTPTPAPAPTASPTPPPVIQVTPTSRSWEYLCWEEDDDEAEWDDDCWASLWAQCGEGERLNDDCVQSIVNQCGGSLDDCFDD